MVAGRSLSTVLCTSSSLVRQRPLQGPRRGPSGVSNGNKKGVAAETVGLETIIHGRSILASRGTSECVFRVGDQTSRE